MQHVVVRGRAAYEAREVPEPHVPQARNVLHRRVKVLVRQLFDVFDRREAAGEEEAVVAVTEEADGAGRPQLDIGEAELPGGLHGEIHDDVGDDAGHGRAACVEVREEAAEWPEAGLRGGLAQRRDVLRDVVVVGRRQAVRDGGEAEARDAGHLGGATGADEVGVVVLGVDEGDVEAAGVEHPGHVEHGDDVPLCVTSSSSDGGRPSGMVAKQKPGTPATSAGPRERTRWAWLY
ncbi:hypothetical protein TRIUR3_00511 [Triticum urartu]|uniref:Uncharacterized protein n=1 Tax=Triticum urartu TaxID=4572 RepID=M7ZJD3_TRIUA|nr:hypothetical protein TRIUR3_00511 [Triticum urartu]